MSITTAGQIMDLSSALMNDTDKQVYTYDKQLPYLKIALRELSELLELANVPVTQKLSAVLTIPIGITTVGYATNPALPASLIQIINVFESSEAGRGFVRVVPADYIPAHHIGETNSSFG